MNMDTKTRCFGSHSKLYADYHDNEWGKQVYDDVILFEFLILEGAQAGLNWETVLKKREGYRKAFYNFDPVKVAAMTNVQLEELRTNEAIIRNRLKIASARKNAIVFLAIQQEFGSFSNYLWSFINNTPIKGNFATLKDVPTTTKESDTLSKDLKKRGMSFVGSTIMYAYMQAVGMVNDHYRECWCYEYTY